MNRFGISPQKEEKIKVVARRPQRDAIVYQDVPGDGVDQLIATLLSLPDVTRVECTTIVSEWWAK